MIAAILLSISIVAFGQFVIHYWRATIASASQAPISDRVLLAAGISRRRLHPQDFRVFLHLRKLSPNLRGSSGSFVAVRCYFSAVEKLGRLIPNLAAWADVEMTTCSDYMAAMLDQHLQRNMECAARLRSM